MEMIKKIYVVLLISTSVFLTSCVTEEGPFFTEIDTPLEVSFSQDIQPIFNSRCIQCHDQNHPTGLDLRSGMSYNLLVNVTSANYAPAVRIAPNSLENSVLWHKVIGDDVFGAQMPLIGDPLSQFQIEQIEAWIEGGALDN